MIRTWDASYVVWMATFLVALLFIFSEISNGTEDCIKNEKMKTERHEDNVVGNPELKPRICGTPKITGQDLIDGMAAGSLSLNIGKSEDTLIRFRFIPDGSFLFGLTEAELKAFRHHTRLLLVGKNSTPAVRVQVKRGFFMQVDEITERQLLMFVRALQRRPMPPTDVETGLVGRFQSASVQPSELDLAAGSITWREADSFAGWMREEFGVEIRLPREIEWEYAARGPHSYLSSNSGDLYLSQTGDLIVRQPSLGWLSSRDKCRRQIESDSSEDRAWRGIRDLSGNLSEWCYDHYSDRIHQQMAPEFEYNPNNPPELLGSKQGERRKTTRVIRGGSYDDPLWLAASSFRMDADENERKPTVGFRLVLIPQLHESDQSK